MRLCCALLNIKKITEITNLNENEKYFKWMEKGFDYPNKDNIVCKSEIVKFKYNNMNIMKNRQMDTLNALKIMKVMKSNMFTNIG